MTALPGPATEFSPDTASWVMAAGLSVSVHIGVVAALALALGSAPAAAPNMGPDIVLRSVPMVAGGAASPPDRLVASQPQSRLVPEDDARTRPETAPRLTPQAVLPDTRMPGIAATELPPLPRAALAPTRVDPVALQPQSAPPAAARVQAPSPRVTAIGAPTAPASAPTATRVQPLQEAPRRAGQALASVGTVTATTQSGPTRAPAAPVTDTSLRQAAMLPPLEDTLERALRDRPRTSLSDRRAAPRPDGGPGGLGAAGTAPEDTRPEQILLADMRAYLRALPDIPCFAALPVAGPVAGDETQPQMTVFGPAQSGLSAFQTGLAAEIGTLPAMALHTVTQGQCEMLDFVRRSRGYPEATLALSLRAPQVGAGQPLTGQVQTSGDRALALVLVDASGRVHNLSRFLRPEDGDEIAEFTVPISTEGGLALQSWQVLLAIATNSPMDTLQTLSTPQEAPMFFARLRAELVTSGQTPALGMAAFVLQ